MESGSSLPCSQEPATCPYKSSLCPISLLEDPSIRFSKWSLSLSFPHHNLVCITPASQMCYMSCPSHSYWFNHTNNCSEGYRLQCAKDGPKDMITFGLFSDHNVRQPWCLERWAIIRYVLFVSRVTIRSLTFVNNRSKLVIF